MRDADERVGAGEEERVVAEDVRHGERRDQHRTHRGEHRDPNRSLLRVDRVRQPGVGGPRPPEDAEDEDPSHQPRPGGVLDDEPGHLCDREDEDEVEEELEGRDPLLGTLLPPRLNSHACKPILRSCASFVPPSTPQR